MGATVVIATRVAEELRDELARRAALASEPVGTHVARLLAAAVAGPVEPVEDTPTVAAVRASLAGLFALGQPVREAVALRLAAVVDAGGAAAAGAAGALARIVAEAERADVEARDVEEDLGFGPPEYTHCAECRKLLSGVERYGERTWAEMSAEQRRRWGPPDSDV